MSSGPGIPLAIGVDVGGTKLEAVALDEHGQERFRRRVATPQGDYDGTVRAIAGLVAAVREELRPASCTIGLGTPGSLTRNGAIKNANSTCLNGRPLPRDLEHVLGQPVRIANDANCLALSEATDGAGAGCDVVFAVILGTGCGGGIAAFSRVLTGPNGLAGEWGHVPLPWRTEADPELPCYCGQKGCLETMLSGTGLAQDYERATGERLTAELVAAHAAAGDERARATIARHADRFARALAAIVDVLDPDVVVVGGGLSRLPSLYVDVPPLVARHVFAAGTDEALRFALRPSRHGDSSGVRGAAWLWRNALGRGTAGPR